MGLRRTGLLTAIALMTGLAGCTPTPDPTPTPTALFSSEEEASKAAEQAYRAYVDEMNAERDGSSDADSNRWLSGRALEAALEGDRSLDEHEARIEGHTSVTNVAPVSAELTANPPSVEIKVCLDVSQARVVTSAGQDLTTPDRELRAPTLIVVQFPAGRPTITSTTLPNETSC